jgi:hypothetical protein
MDPDRFELNFLKGKIFVTRHTIGSNVIFRVVFPEKKTPLVITRTQSSTDKFWTSIPEGRQKEAEEIGGLISEYFKSL